MTVCSEEGDPSIREWLYLRGTSRNCAVPEGTRYFIATLPRAYALG